MHACVHRKHRRTNEERQTRRGKQEEEFLTRRGQHLAHALERVKVALLIEPKLISIFLRLCVHLIDLSKEHLSKPCQILFGKYVFCKE